MMQQGGLFLLLYLIIPMALKSLAEIVLICALKFSILSLCNPRYLVIDTMSSSQYQSFR